MTKKNLIMMGLSVFLLTGLSTSSFFLQDTLSRIIENNEQTPSQLNFALTHNNTIALFHVWQQAEYGSEKWRDISKKLASTEGEVAYQLAEFYLEKKHRDKNIAINSEQAILWYQQAIRLNYFKAFTKLARLYFSQGDILKAQALLDRLPLNKLMQNENNTAVIAVVLMIEIAINEGDVAVIRTLLTQYSLLLQRNEIGISLLSKAAKYRVLVSLDEGRINDDQNAKHCPNSIQVFATTLAHLEQVEQTVKELAKQPLNNAVCFLPVRYIPFSSLSCSSDKQSAILCDESELDDIAASVPSRYIAMMLPKGGANVHFGMLYFDAQDNVDVIAHEISHLLGFIDEYPLTEGHVKCLASQEEAFSQNIAVLQNAYHGKRSIIRNEVLKQLPWRNLIKETTPILHAVDHNSQNDQHWQLGTSNAFKKEVGLFKAKTCDKNSIEQQTAISAFKPLFKRTKLEYNQVDFPSPYLTLLDKHLEQFRMPSFHYNIALAHYQKDNIKQASYWLTQAAKWEFTHSRKDKVKEGRF